jgi:twitching motility two-component system response regulator PilG
MKTILIVDDDKKLHHLVVDGLKAYGSVTTIRTKDFIVKSATNAKEAASVLSRFRVDLIVTEIEGPASDGFQLAAYLNQSDLREIPVIIVAPSSPELESKLEEIGISYYLRKPFVLLELLEKMVGILDESAKALISDFTVPTFLQALEIEKKTCTVKIASEGKIGYLHLENGELINAETNGLEGNAAAIQILGWENTELGVEELSNNKKRIDTDIMLLLIQATHARDRKSDAVPAADSVFDEIIGLAECRHYKQAQKKLTALLKANPRNHKGWLWYSRVTDKVESIEKSLNNARKIAPDDPEVGEEIEKVELAKKQLEGEQFSRCPFCWAPLNLKVLECPYCRAFLFIDAESLTRKEAANREILQQAVDRYTGVVTRETNPETYYYLGIAHLNLEQWEQGLDRLESAVEASPEDETYVDQLQMLMNFVTSSEDVFAQEIEEKEIGSDIAPTTAEETDTKKVLVAESNPTIRKAISMALSKRGYEVIEAADGLEALNSLDKKKADVILMDAILGKLEAQTVLSAIRESSRLKDIPVIALTSKGGLFGGGKKKLAGSTAHLSKPFDLSELLETIEKYSV